MTGINSTTIASSVRSLSDTQRKAYQKTLTEADGANGDGILTQEEFNKGNQAFFNTDEFKSLSEADQESFQKQVNADAVWGQQGAVNYDGNKLQIEYYENLLKDPANNKDKDGNPIVTEEQLQYAKENGFGDIDGKNGIDGKELSADINGDRKIDFKDGDITGDGKVSRDDKGVDLRTSEAKPGGNSGGGMKIDANAMRNFVNELVEIWT